MQEIKPTTVMYDPSWDLRRRQCVASLKDIYFLGTTGLTGRKEVVTEGRTGMKDMYNKGTGERLFVGKSV